MIVDTAQTLDRGLRLLGLVADAPGGVTVTEAAARLEETALKVYEILGCSGFARVDTILEDGVPQVLDVKTVPGFTETSTFPLAAEAAGITFENLVETILEATLQTEAAAKL